MGAGRTEVLYELRRALEAALRQATWPEVVGRIHGATETAERQTESALSAGTRSRRRGAREEPDENGSADRMLLPERGRAKQEPETGAGIQ